MRLIDKDEILRDLENGVYPASMTYTLAVDIAKGLIEVASEIDAVPVVRGYSYEDDKTYSGPGTSNYICSVCGEMQGTWKKGLAQNQKFKFCPWCGAKMEDKP